MCYGKEYQRRKFDFIEWMFMGFVVTSRDKSSAQLMIFELNAKGRKP